MEKRIRIGFFDSGVGGVSVIAVGVVLAACAAGYLWLLPQLMHLLG